MLNLIRADLYRLLNKKSNYAFLLLSSLAFTVIMIIIKISTPLGEQSFSPEFFNSVLFSSLFISVVFISTNILICVYCDDLSSGQINHLYSNILSKSQYVIAKFIVLAIYVLVYYIFFGIVFFVDFYIFSDGFYSDITPYMQYISQGFVLAIICYLSILVYTLLGTVILYTTSKPIEAIIATILFSTNMIAQIYDLISKVIAPLNWLKPFLYDYILKNLFDETSSATKVIVAAIIYIAVFLAFNMFYLNTMELKTE